ncbi:unnamed protein product [marine sediment metagenome]|uniref:Uncharacterized protein n=1 Tax=marine sediment metagenome TaxID=412755 RepID=X1UAT6_9ZZZZ
MGKKKKKYKIIYPEYKECENGIDIRIRPVKLYDEVEGFAPQYRLNKGKHSWEEVSMTVDKLEADLLLMKAEFKEKARELHRERKQKERELLKKNESNWKYQR